MSANKLNRLLISLVVLAFSSHLSAQTCSTADDMGDANRSALTTTAQRYFDLMSHGDSDGLKQHSVDSLAANFGSIDALVKRSQSKLAQAHANPRPPFLLKADAASGQQSSGEFLCGVFGSNGQTANSAEFVLSGLAPGNYAVAIVDTDASAITFVLQQVGTDWKLAGLYLKDTRVGGHDSDWFEKKADGYKAKGQNHNAWLYYLEARDLVSTVPFMSTQKTDKLYDQEQSVKPSDIPVDAPVSLVAGTKTFKLTEIFPSVEGNDLDLIVKYQSADVSNAAAVFQDNTAVMKALVAKFPEFRDAFDGVVARAVEPSGRDYGSLMSMKDIK